MALSNTKPSTISTQIFKLKKIFLIFQWNCRYVSVQSVIDDQVEIFLLFFLCDTRPNRWDTQWDSNSLLMVYLSSHYTMWGQLFVKSFFFFFINIHVFSCQNFWDEAWWFLSLRVFRLLSSSLLLFPQRFGR